MVHKILAIIFLTIGLSLNANDSIDTSVANGTDLLQQQLHDLTLLIEKNREQKIIDSVRRVDMLTELNKLKTSDRTKREVLKQKIDEIEQQNQERINAQKQQITSLRKTAKGYPVVPFSDTIFTIYTKIGPFRANERAINITNKIKSVYATSNFVADSIKVKSSETTTDIIFHNSILMSITDWDALWFETTKDSLANTYHNTIVKSLVQEKQNNSTTELLWRIGSTFLILLLIYLLIHYINKLHQKIAARLDDNKEKYLKGIKLKTYHFLTPEQEFKWSLNILSYLKWLIIIILIYLALPSIFSIFPFTKGWATTLYQWIWYPFKGIVTSFFSYLPNLITILVIYVVVRYINRVIRYMAHEIEIGKLTITGFHPDWAMPTFSIVRFLLFAFMFVVIFPYLPGSDSDVFKGVSVFLGILLSLGSSSAIANMVAGLVITYMRPFKIGDRIKIGDVSGDVVEKTLLVTRVKTIKNEEITIPNANLLTGHTTNYSVAATNSKGLIVHTTITIGYDVPWHKVHEAMLEAAARTNFLLEEPAPFILQTALNDFYVSYQLNAYTLAASKQAIIYSELHQRIQDVFKENNIEITSPHFRAMRNGNASTIPE